MRRLALADPGDDRLKKRDLSGVALTPISVSIPVTDHEWLSRFAKYLNEVVKAEYKLKGGKPPKGEADQSRAGLAQEGLLAFVEQKRAELQPIIEKLGELPDPKGKDKLAMKRYAAKAVELEEQSRPKSKRI